MVNNLMRIAGVMVTSLVLFTACGEDECEVTQDRQANGAELISFSCTNFCHSETRTGEERMGAPEGMDFDTPEQTFEYADEIYESISRTENPMPPGGGLRPDQVEDVRLYLTCGTQQ